MGIDMAVRKLRNVPFLKGQNRQIELLAANAFHHSLVQRSSRTADGDGNPVEQILDDLLIGDAILRIATLPPTDRRCDSHEGLRSAACEPKMGS
jgi:hypothetical protein